MPVKLRLLQTHSCKIVCSEAPETSFDCEGKSEIGYYADHESDCQSFHICIPDGAGHLEKFTFLCPNGTVYDQDNFYCDWWYNVDCHGGPLAKARATSIVQS